MTCGVITNWWLRMFTTVAAVATSALLAIIGIVVIPQQAELSRRQEEALRNHDILRKHQVEILQRISSLEGQTKVFSSVVRAVDK